MFRSALNIIAAAHVLDRSACVESYDEITDQGTRLKKLLRTNFSEGTEHTFHGLDRLACNKSYDEIMDQGTRLKKLLRK